MLQQLLLLSLLVCFTLSKCLWKYTLSSDMILASVYPELGSVFQRRRDLSCGAILRHAVHMALSNRNNRHRQRSVKVYSRTSCVKMINFFYSECCCLTSKTGGRLLYANLRKQNMHKNVDIFDISISQKSTPSAAFHDRLEFGQ